MQRLTILKVAIVVADTLPQIKVALSAIAIAVKKSGAKDGDLAITFDGEVNVLS
jgi:hypothetical protein